MAYPLLRTSSLVLSPQLFDSSGGIDFPSGTTFSANTSDFNIATANYSGGVVTLTPQGSVTGNVYVNLTATLPNGDDIVGSLLVHVMNSPLSTADYIVLTPEI